MTPDDVRQEIELKVVEMIKTKLNDGIMTDERSREISQIVLDILKPNMSWEELYSAIFTLDDTCVELAPIVVPYARQYEENVTKKVTGMVSNYIRIGQYDTAVNLAENTIRQKVQLRWEGSGKSTD